MNIAVFGLGHVGCASAVCFARAGHRVTGVDLNEAKVSLVNAGRSPILEPGLGELLARVVASGRLSATSDAAAAVRESHVALVCVGAAGAGYGRLAVEAIDRVGRQIGAAIPAANEPYTVVLRRAVLPGTTERVLLPALLAGLNGRPGARVRVAMHPEFTRKGSSIDDFHAPAMIVVGTDDPGAAALVRSMYSGVKAPFVHTTTPTAELAKYASESPQGPMFDGVAGLSALADSLGADADDARRILALNQEGGYGWTRPRRMAYRTSPAVS